MAQEYEQCPICERVGGCAKWCKAGPIPNTIEEIQMALLLVSNIEPESLARVIKMLDRAKAGELERNE